ncbi:P-loop ATPase, Sll1717 family [Fusibacter sp. JL298sf-3]
MKKEFQDFVEDIGLIEYPFATYTAENEGEKTKSLFVKPYEFSILENTIKSNNSAIIVGNRGSGKTLILKELSGETSPNKLFINLSDFENITLSQNKIDYHNLLIKRIVDTLAVFLIGNEKLIKTLTKDDKLFLSFLIYKYGDNVTEDQIKNKISAIQLSKVKRIIKKFSKPINAIFNYGATAFTNFSNEAITKHFGTLLPQADESTIKNIFPDIEFDLDLNFIDEQSSLKLVNKLLELISKLNIVQVAVHIDKLDEDERLENDAELVATFIEPLILGNQLLVNKKIQLLIAIWTIPFDLLSSRFRKQKYYVYNIDWTIDDLKSVLNKRLLVHSNDKTISFDKLLDNSVPEETIASIFMLANSNPRDLWHIWHQIFRAQYRIDPNATKFSKIAINNALENFVREFNFYEYYPKKKGARQNSNDVYSYIKHLQKLSTSSFTHSQLKEEANTGGSTRNYITGMQNIGLIKKLSRKHEGSAVYEIKDPKIIYALNNNIDLDN